MGWAAREAVEIARASIATNLGAETDELIFTSGATEADNIGVIGAALGAPPQRRRILVGATEHKAVLESANATTAFGFTVETVPVDQNGLIDIRQLRTMLQLDVAVVSIMAVNNEIGTIQDIEAIARLVSEAGAFSHCDATQAPAAMEIDLSAWGVDAASFSSHKIYGPKGIGALYLSALAPWRPKPLMFGGGQEGGLRPGTIPAPLCAGFASAMAIIRRKGIAERSTIEALRNHLASSLRSIHPALVETSTAVSRHPGNLHVRFPGINAGDLVSRLQPYIAVSTGSACTSGRASASHVLQAIGLTDYQAAEGLRFSVGRFSNFAEIDRAVKMIKEALERIAGGC